MLVTISIILDHNYINNMSPLSNIASLLEI